MTQNILHRIQRYNEGRNPELLERKYTALRSDPFVFLRGTNHLFYEDWPRDSPLNAAPPVWICGDLHLENFGSYRGDNQVVYFDMNDFDEGVLAPATWEIARMLTSILVGGRSIKVNEPEALGLCHIYLEAYTTELSHGHPRAVDRDEATGMIRELLDSLASRTDARAAFLNKRTAVKKGRRRFTLDGARSLPVSKDAREPVEAAFRAWAKAQKNPKYFKLLDIAIRIAGTGSLGVPRYQLLVEGDGSPNANVLLDLKRMRPSALSPYLTVPQPAWANDAERAAAVQRRLQATPVALLQPLLIEDKPFVLREMQPTQDRVALGAWNGRIRRLERVMTWMGKITAWNQLRSTGRQGSASTDRLIEFAVEPGWRWAVLEYAHGYAKKVVEDFQAFKEESAKLGSDAVKRAGAK